MGTEYTTGIKTDMVTQQLDASDQVSFIKNGIPSVQFFSGPNLDYHRPTDTVDKIDADGLVKVAAVAKEVLEYLAEREEPLKYIGTKKLSGNEKNSITKESKKVRRVSTGTIPDFAFSGEGVKVSGVAPGSAGKKAGLQKGDVIKKFNGKAVKNLRDYSNYLKEHQPGDKVTMTVERNGKTKKIKLILGER
ncbi:putative periplasmic serine endoprotease DegP-like precursor [bacterium BMS3Abin04]|nr:putative periplasmic serine endoprotease DegP-like precursor [bacterium BMS3Abin04]